MKWMAVVLGLLTPLGAGAEEEWWAGHQVVVGSRKIPVLGELETRSDTFVLARVVRDGDDYVLEQTSCKFEIAKVAGVRIAFPEEARFPPTSIRFRRDGDGARVVAEPWVIAWAEEDVDRDGKPGATVLVDAPICDGSLFVGARSRSLARGEAADDGLHGELRVEVEQKIHGTSRTCLSMMAKDSADKLRGTFAYKRVPAGTTCASLLLGGAWPVRAEEPRRAQEPPRRERIRIR